MAPKTTVEDIYASILRQAGVSIEAGSTSEHVEKIGGQAGVKFKATIPLIFDAELNGGASGEASQREAIRNEAIPFSISLPQDVSELLHKIGYRKKIILENFHYLDEDLQRQISFDLRLFQEMGILFVVLGVWRQKDKLRIYCSDLTDRVIDVPVEPWGDNDFQEVATRGAKELNAELGPEIVDTCIANSFGSIGVFQELMREACDAGGLKERGDTIFGVYNEDFVETAIQEKSDQYGTTHRQALELIASGNVTHSKDKALQPLHLPYYLTLDTRTWI